jgi:protein-S-isoprenylcysteine O-methyltransferase Ste14
MYLGFLLWLIGPPIYSGGFFSVILSLLFICNVLFWRYLEEKELEKRFPAYLDYKKLTLF